MMPTANQVWLVVEAIDMLRHRRPLAANPEHPGPFPLRRQRLRLPQPSPESAQAPHLGWHRRLALPAAPASRPLHMAQRGHPGLHPDRRPMAMARHRRGLAAPGRPATGPLAGLAKPPIRGGC